MKSNGRSNIMAKKKPKNVYGEGSIFYSNVKKKWMAQINVGKDENGKFKRLPLPVTHLKKLLRSYNRLSMKYIVVISLMYRILHLISLHIKLLRTSLI